MLTTVVKALRINSKCFFFIINLYFLAQVISEAIYTTLQRLAVFAVAYTPMENSFEALITTYIDSKVGISENFLTTDLSNNLRQNILNLQSKSLLKAAGIGNADMISYDSEIRSDSIYWLDKKHNDPFENQFFEQMEAFILYLNESCYTGITDYEFHYALYEEGDFYLQHLDQFKSNPSRKYSIISYLNPDWQISDGGELQIHQNGVDQKISPNAGKTVFFKSDELLHEVLLTNKTRMSITGWLKCDSIL